jgi:hypothetical protein
LYNKQNATNSNASIQIQLYYVSSTLYIRTTYSTNGTSSTIYDTPIQALESYRWYHIAVSRDTVNLRHYVDGIQQGTTHNIGTANLNNSPNNVVIGATNIGQTNFVGWIDDFRVTKGLARYTSDGTTPTSELANDANTSLLLNMNGTHGSVVFTDSSSNTHSVAVTGSHIIWGSPNKFGNGSLYCDGASYCKIIANENFGLYANNFTIDCWVFLRALPASGAGMCFCSQRSSATSNQSFYLGILNNSGTMQAHAQWSYNGSTAQSLAANFAFAVNTWYHIALVRNGTNINYYVDGTSVGSVAVSTNSIFYSSADFVIGACNTTKANFFSGWIDELRFVNGTAKWSSNFSVPTIEY